MIFSYVTRAPHSGTVFIYTGKKRYTSVRPNIVGKEKAKSRAIWIR